MMLLSALLCVVILLFPTTASGLDSEPDAVSGARSQFQQTAEETYSILPSAQRGGSVTSSVSDSQAGRVVTFSVEADDGWETASVDAISALGTALEVVRVKGETYKFVMPSCGVIIDVSFQLKAA